jgi:hypothetical protein
MARTILEDNQKIYGYNGIKGDRFAEVPGWEKGTVGFSGNVYSKLASENGIQPVDPVLTAMREPFKVGRFLIKILKTVPFFHKKVMATWRYIIEDTAITLAGIQNYAFDTIERSHGVIRQNSYYGGTYKENNGEFQITVPETKAQIVRKAIDYWLQGMSDPKTGVAHFYGKDIPDLQPNKSMTILYVLLGPTCRPDDIEYACIWHDAIIGDGGKHEINNAGTLGDPGQGQEHTISFRGIFDRGPQVDLLASIIVDREGLYEERSWNAALPQYMYDEYFKDKGPERADYNITIANRLANEIGLEGDSSNPRTGKAYGDKGTYEQIKTSHSPLFIDAVADPGVNGLLGQGGKASPTSPNPLG